MIISLINQKGGVGKTTTTLALGASLARKLSPQKILIIDLDSQKNASSVLLNNKEVEIEDSVFPIFDQAEINSRHIHNTGIENLTIIPASLRLVEVESLLSNSIDGFFRLRDKLEKIKNEFAYIIIDCPPSLSTITINAMVASDGLIVPLQVSKFSLDGIQGIIDAVASVKKRYNANLKILGGLLTMFNARTTLSKAMLPRIKNLLNVFDTKISKSVAVEEAHLLKQDLYSYDPSNKVSLAYEALTDEVLSRTSSYGQARDR